MDLGKFLDTITQSWQAKAIASFFITLITFLFGKTYLPLAILGAFIIFDLVTKFICLGQKAAAEQGVQAGYVQGIMIAWRTRAINSHTMREKFQKKIYGYLVSLIVANLLAKVLVWEIAGQGVVVFVSSYLAVVEAKSIFENLADTGIDAVRPLVNLLGKKQREMVGEILKGDDKNG